MSDVDLWMKRHLYVCKADWSKYEAMYEPQKSDPKLTELLCIEELQQTILELRTENTQLKARLDEITIKETEERTKIAEKSEMEKHTHTNCWICATKVENKYYDRHVQNHRGQLKPLAWFKLNEEEYYRVLREGPVVRSPCGKIGWCIGCTDLIPFSRATSHMRICNKAGTTVTKWWATAQNHPDYRPEFPPKKELMNQIVGNPEITQAPPTPPTLSVQSDSTETEPRNEIHHDSSESETPDDDDWETRSNVSCSPMDYWDMESPGVQSIFDALSDILEQGMEYKDARAEYRALLKELKPIRGSIGKPYKVLEAYILADYTKKDLGNFLSLQD
tara:strand:+ start:315 stop:1313 length:999 start_codon:yes stop_codon:yes gene_type:complete